MLLVCRQRHRLLVWSTAPQCVSYRNTESSRKLGSPQIFRHQGKSDKILETVLRMDGLLRSIHENLVRIPARVSVVSRIGLILDRMISSVDQFRHLDLTLASLRHLQVMISPRSLTQQFPRLISVPLKTFSIPQSRLLFRRCVRSSDRYFSSRTTTPQFHSSRDL